MPPTLQNILSATPWLLPLLVSIMALSLAALWRLRWRDYALPRRLQRLQETEGNPPAIKQHSGEKRIDTATLLSPNRPRLSVIIPCCNQARELEENLPYILEQDFDDFEVIIVDEASTDGTREVIELMEVRYPNLRHTFVPTSAHYLDRRKLALTLGIKAARTEWIVLTQADCRPETREWLALMAASCSDDTDLVLGYANYEDYGDRTARRAIYERLRRQLQYFRSASKKAIGGEAANMAVRKSWFIAGDGYTDSLTVSGGEDVLLIDALSVSGRTAIVAQKEASVRQELPHPTLLQLERIARREVLRHGSRNVRRYLLREGAATLSGWFFFTSLMAYVILRLYEVTDTQTYATANIPADAATLLLLTALVAIPTRLFRRATDCFDEHPYSFALLVHYAVLQPWRNAATKWKRWRRRHEFIRR